MISKQIENFLASKCSSKASARVYKKHLTDWQAAGCPTLADYIERRYTSDATKNSAAAILSSFCRFSGISDEAKHKCKQSFGTKDALTQEEISLLLSLASPKMNACILLGVICGLRISDIAGLRWSNIDSAGVAHITRKGMKESSIGLTAGLLEALEGIRRPGNDYCIPNQRGGLEGVSVGSIGADFKRLLDKAGINRPGISFHSLRHSCAVLSLKNGVAMNDIQRLLGHSFFSTTVRYLQTFENKEAIAAAKSKLEGLFS